jgi:hypothetical protein
VYRSRGESHKRRGKGCKLKAQSGPQSLLKYAHKEVISNTRSQISVGRGAVEKGTALSHLTKSRSIWAAYLRKRCKLSLNWAKTGCLLRPLSKQALAQAQLSQSVVTHAHHRSGRLLPLVLSLPDLLDPLYVVSLLQAELSGLKTKIFAITAHHFLSGPRSARSYY